MISDSGVENSQPCFATTSDGECNQLPTGLGALGDISLGCALATLPGGRRTVVLLGPQSGAGAVSCEGLLGGL